MYVDEEAWDKTLQPIHLVEEEIILAELVGCGAPGDLRFEKIIRQAIFRVEAGAVKLITHLRDCSDVERLALCISSVRQLVPLSITFIDDAAIGFRNRRHGQLRRIVIFEKLGELSTLVRFRSNRFTRGTSHPDRRRSCRASGEQCSGAEKQKAHGIILEF